MAIDPPYRFDPFQNLVNVSWLRRRDRLWYFVNTIGLDEFGHQTWTWTGPFCYVYDNTYNPAFDPPEPEDSDPYPPLKDPDDPNPTSSYDYAIYPVHTYSLKTFKLGPSDWCYVTPPPPPGYSLFVPGNGWLFTATFWNYLEAGWRIVIVWDTWCYWPRNVYDISLGAKPPPGWPVNDPPPVDDHPPLP